MKTKNELSKFEKPLFNKKAIYLGMLPGFLFFLIFRLTPSASTFFLSFTDIMQIPGRAASFIGLDNYNELFLTNNSRDLWMSFRKTIVFSSAVTVIQITLALIMALLLNKKYVKGRNLYRTVIFLPTILGVTVTGLCFKLFFNIDGPAQEFIGLFGMHSAFFGDWNLAFPLVIFVQIWMSAGYAMVIFIAGLQTIPQSLYEAANIDGASSWQEFWNITLPLLWPTVIVNVTLTLIGSLSKFETILVTTNGSIQTRTLSMFVYTIAYGIGMNSGNSNVGRQGFAAAMQMVLFVFILIITLTMRKLMNRKRIEV